MKINQFLAVSAVALSPLAAHAQPAEVWKYHQQLGGGDLYLEFCFAGYWPCVDHKAIAFGQVCDSYLAESVGMGESGDYEGIVPPGFSYVGFRCGEGARFHPKTDKVSGGGNWMD